jgi:hypothetical protein
MVRLTFDIHENDDDGEDDNNINKDNEDTMVQTVDDYDLKDSFDALVGKVFGRITVEEAYQIILGLGYIKDYKMGEKFTTQTIQQTVDMIKNEQREEEEHNGDDQGDYVVSLDILQKIIQIYSTAMVLQKRDRDANLRYTFGVIDSDNKGYITAQDLRKLSKNVDESMISEEEANAMITASKNNNNNDNNNNDNVEHDDDDDDDEDYQYGNNVNNENRKKKSATKVDGIDFTQYEKLFEPPPSRLL